MHRAHSPTTHAICRRRSQASHMVARTSARRPARATSSLASGLRTARRHPRRRPPLSFVVIHGSRVVRTAPAPRAPDSISPFTAHCTCHARCTCSACRVLCACFFPDACSPHQLSSTTCLARLPQARVGSEHRALAPTLCNHHEAQRFNASVCATEAFPVLMKCVCVAWCGAAHFGCVLVAILVALC
jgi:hypothetical protein